MKLHGFLLPALAGTAAAETTPRQAEAYILTQQHQQHPQSTTSSNTPSIPNKLAEAILLQRLSSPEQPSPLGRLPESLNQDEAVAFVNQFGKPSLPLFQDADANEPSQLVIAFSGITPDRYDELKSAVSSEPVAFTTPELSAMPIRASTGCSFGSSIDPQNSKCWKGKTQYLHYDVTKDKSVIAQLESNLASLKAQVSEGKLETTILFLTPSSAAGSEEELRRRDRADHILTSNSDPGHVMADFAKDVKGKAKAPVKSSSSFHTSSAADRPAVIPSCFTSHNACVTATNDCSGHGQCIDRWAADASTSSSCFFCRCQAAKEYDDVYKSELLYHWGGGACQKRDVSTPFWLFAGVTIALVSTVAFSIGLLFSVGEEKLPGVIGAGVSRTK
ncbi:hypothetical protein F4809DRAFT_261725 [Biscogniauxia mediterranea]|nr:hypothetical protein F4809DRAFT_261725 [Biscogniauxia mediterranea]